MGISLIGSGDKQTAGELLVTSHVAEQLLKRLPWSKLLHANRFTLTEHDERGRPLFVSRRVCGVFAGVATSVGHFEVRYPNGRILQAVVQEHNSVFEELVGETLSVDWMIHGDVVPLSVHGLPNPRHLGRRELINKRPQSTGTTKHRGFKADSPIVLHDRNNHMLRKSD